ncbi:hypothetical protein Q0Z83_015070 [Actinoplanes sichuanensis]|uniref:Uncharacterized protein n=1 Tax=Actinoplanes sichuanensis TaxID=512349 RepID=A0ABW4A7N3_9ACTN|nr:hypothetical protein [Actinoplanes sichuanensis]BEL03316.1 hypothetical protein Q0Z83_015070 [Actinoplanes sichuanensis]
MLGTVTALLAWAATIDYSPLAGFLAVLVSALAAVFWQARRTGLLGPLDNGAVAWTLRAAGYALAVAVAGFAIVHTHPATLEAADTGAAILTLATVATAFVTALALVFSPAVPARVRYTAIGGSLAATLIWLSAVVIAAPIPATVGWALAAAGAAAITAVLADARPSGTTAGGLIAGLLAVAGTLALIFAAVVALAHWGPDALIPNVTPHAPAGRQIAESRIEIVDPYIVVLVLSAVAATALSLTAVFAPTGDPRRAP